jgi:hypothetical protein
LKVQADLSAFSTTKGTIQMRNDVSPDPTVLPTDQARQGVTGHNVRYVLGFGLAGVVIGFLVIGFLFA